MLFVVLLLIAVAAGAGVAVKHGTDWGAAAGGAAVLVFIILVIASGHQDVNGEDVAKGLEAYLNWPQMLDGFSKVIGFGWTVSSLVVGFLGGYAVAKSPPS